jgi:hypothetical protein
MRPAHPPAAPPPNPLPPAPRCASLRTPDHVRREWAERHGLPSFCTPDYDAAMDAVLTRLGVHSETKLNGNNGALYDGLCAMGADARKLPRNCLSDECSGYCSLGCKSGNKMGTDASYLADAARRGARVLTGVRARRVLTERAAAGGARGRKAAGVEVVVGGEEDNFNAPNGTRLVVRAPIVIASAGSIHSVRLGDGGRMGWAAAASAWCGHLLQHLAVPCVACQQPREPASRAPCSHLLPRSPRCCCAAASRATATWAPTCGCTPRLA